MPALPAAVLFDLDGTLVDTEPLWQKAQRRLALDHGTHWDPAVIEQVIGRGLIEGAEILAESTGVRWSPEAIVDYLVDSVCTDMKTDGLEWFPGIDRLFSLLRGLEVPAGLVTSSYRVLAQVVADMAPAGTFIAVVAGDEVANCKPHPEPYLKAATQMGLPIANALVIEDSPVGVAAGLAAGAQVVAIPKIVPVQAVPGLSRLRSAEELDEAMLRGLAAGRCFDTL